jgi:hypothetical protein
MYNEVYLNMVNAGVATRLENLIWMNSSGESVDNLENEHLCDFNTDPAKPLTPN